MSYFIPTPTELSTYWVTVRTDQTRIMYRQQGTDSAAVHMAALDRYGICSVTVLPD